MNAALGQLSTGYSFVGDLQDCLSGKLIAQADTDLVNEKLQEGSFTDYDGMAIALRESMKGAGQSNPNPAVGCLIVKGTQVISLSHTQAYGGSHAERHALQKVGLSKVPDGSRVYVTLEPCSHVGQTLPCVDLFADSKDLHIVVASLDPNPLVGGDGIKKLESFGHRVEVGCLQLEARATLLPFLKMIRATLLKDLSTLSRAGQDSGCVEAVTKRTCLKTLPFVGLKWAQSIDGKLADDSSVSKWLTGERASRYTHFLRQKYDVIVVGFGTLIADEPKLNVRFFESDMKIRHPIRICLDPFGKFMNLTSQRQLEILDRAESENPWIVVSSSPQSVSIGKNHSPIVQKQLGSHFLMNLSQAHFIGDFFEFLGSDFMKAINSGRQIQSVLVEGGATIHSHFLSQGMFDLIHCLTAPLFLGGDKNTVTKRGVGSSFPVSLETAKRLKILQSFVAGDDSIVEWMSESTAELCFNGMI